MARLPINNSDPGTWGALLNEYLSVAHNADGTLKPDVAIVGATGPTGPTGPTGATGAAGTSGLYSFPDAATRDATLTTPSDGTRAYTVDTGITWTYITVSGVGYWAPPTGMALCQVYATAAQTFTTAVQAVVTMTGVRKNYGSWWASNKFTPKVPGWYFLTGGIHWTANTTGYRYAILKFNNTSFPETAGMHPGSSFNHTTNLRPIYWQFNGTTDYMELIGIQTSGGNLDTNNSSGFQASFGASYAGQ